MAERDFDDWLEDVDEDAMFNKYIASKSLDSFDTFLWNQYIEDCEVEYD